jgi:hypothetical protein
VPLAGSLAAGYRMAMHRARLPLPSARFVHFLFVALVAAALFTPRRAGAVEFTDTRDGFVLTVDPPGLPACVTYPVARFDRVECGGLDAAREAALRASAPAGTQWVGASVFRNDAWGFRLSITRADALPGTADEGTDQALLREGRNSLMQTLEPGQLVGGEAGLLGELITIGERDKLRVARFAFAFTAEGLGVLHSIVYMVPADVGRYTVTLLADRRHAGELAVIADRAMASLHVRSRPRAAPLLATVLLYGVVPTAALIGALILAGRLASNRRRGQTPSGWPSLRDEERPEERSRRSR